MTTVRTVRDQIRNALDYLIDAELALFVPEVSMGLDVVAWHSHAREGAFIEGFEHPTIDQYVTWLTNGDYSALLYDGSLIQLSYTVEDGEVTRHRLCYFPCPYNLDHALLREGQPLADIVDLYRDSDAVLRSPIRFDFDSEASAKGHPASHFTINGADCRIACVARLHVMRFLDFIFRHFHGRLHAAHRTFFATAHALHIGPGSLADNDRKQIHFAWDLHATATGGAIGR